MADGDFTGRIDAPVLTTIAKEVLALIQQDKNLREIQSRNAPRASAFRSGTVTNTVAIFCDEIRNGSVGWIPFALYIVFDPTAGAANYRIDGGIPTATVGSGLPIPAGGGELTIIGNDNIRNFAMIAQGATTLPFFYVIFR